MNERTNDTAATDSMGEAWTIDVPGTPARWAMRFLALAATALTGFLFLESRMAGPLPGCGAGSGCDAVLSSHWSKWFGVPVAGPAMLLYLAMLLLLGFVGPSTPPRHRRLAWLGLVTLAAAAVLAIGWFVTIQLFVIDAICPYCMLDHALGLTLCIFVMVQAARSRRAGRASDRPTQPQWIGAVAVALAAALTLSLGQVFGPRPPVAQTVQRDFDTGPGSDRVLAVLDGRVRLHPADYPMLGSPDARFVFVSLFDYTCGFCQLLHQYMEQALERYGDQVAFVVLPVPMDAACNPAWAATPPANENACEYARLALATWRVDREAFHALDGFLFSDYPPPPIDAARAKAESLIGAEALATALADDWASEQLERYMTVHAISGQRQLPQLFGNNLYVPGAPAGAEALFAAFERHLGIAPVEGEPIDPSLADEVMTIEGEDADVGPVADEADAE